MRVIMTLCLLASAVLLLNLYRSLRAANGGRGVSGPPAAHAASIPRDLAEAGWISDLRGPFVLNGMTMEVAGESESETLDQRVCTMAAYGWREIPAPASTNISAELVRGYRILQRGSDTRLLMQLGWIPGIAMCTFPAGLPVVSPLSPAGGEWVDVPGRDPPGARRPEGARRMMSLEFSGGSLTCYQLPAPSGGSGAADSALKQMAAAMAADQWTIEPGTDAMNLAILRRSGTECWIWMPPRVADVPYIAVLMRGIGEQ